VNRSRVQNDNKPIIIIRSKIVALMNLQVAHIGGSNLIFKLGGLRIKEEIIHISKSFTPNQEKTINNPLISKNNNRKKISAIPKTNKTFFLRK
jgi:hypothetical protein